MIVYVNSNDDNIDEKLGEMRANVGFVTIATGKEKYHKMANVLMKSYKNTSSNPKRFCVITDCESKYTSEFDDVIVLGNSTRSYLDKIQLLKIAPYKETIFIDADCLAFRDLNVYFDIFNASHQDFGVFGRVLSIENEEGWFTENSLGKYRNFVYENIDIHGGIYYIKPGKNCDEMFNYCMDIIKDYSSFKFKKFKKPADEPIIALAMAVIGYKPIKSKSSYYAWYRKTKNIRANYFNQKLNYTFDNIETKDGFLIHFGTVHTICILYMIESQKIEYYNKYKRAWGKCEYVERYIICGINSILLYMLYAIKRIIKKFRI